MVLIVFLANEWKLIRICHCKVTKNEKSWWTSVCRQMNMTYNSKMIGWFKEIYPKIKFYCSIWTMGYCQASFIPVYPSGHLICKETSENVRCLINVCSIMWEKYLILQKIEKIFLKMHWYCVSSLSYDLGLIIICECLKVTEIFNKVENL